MARPAIKTKTVQVTIKVPSGLADALDQHVSSRRAKTRSNRLSRSELVTLLLKTMIETLRDDRDLFGRLLVAEAVREAASKLHYTTVADVRKRLASVPQPVLDRTLLSLESEGAFQLAPSYNGNILTEEERAGGVKDAKRGNLVYAVTDMPPPSRKTKRPTVR